MSMPRLAPLASTAILGLFAVASCSGPELGAGESMTTGPITFTATVDPPVFDDLSDEEVAALVEADREARASGRLPGFQRYSIEAASAALPGLWRPTYLPAAFELTLGIVIAAPEVDDLREAGVAIDVADYQAPPPQLTVPGRNGGVLTITVSPIGTGQLQVPVAPGSVRTVRFGAWQGTIVYGHWLVQLTADRNEVRRGWDPTGAKRLVFVRDGRLVEIDVMPASAISDGELLRIAAGLQPAEEP